ncbi:hypothetical protein FVE85_9398 [Porphyridium purpureum]|uniref:Integrase catalytic domain-containing protein n=1 Tax=Porphyridium purpureum TaxID=35688 RepID=A0A5J4YHK5_PORPP|nr:hypothetical protein FVE85_9398 [Porphyridium purpureum]|eukprot:POR3085..scf255_21
MDEERESSMSPVSSRTRAAAASASQMGRSAQLEQKTVSAGSDASGSSSGTPEGIPWGLVHVTNPEARGIMNLVTEISDDDHETLMVEGIVTFEILMERGGPVTVRCWQQYCRQRGLPNFEAGRNIQDSFAAYRGLDQVETVRGEKDSNARSGDGFSHHRESAFVRHLERFVFTGEPGMAKRTLPLVLDGRASALIASLPEDARLGTMLRVLKESFDSEDKREQHLAALSRMTLDQFISKASSRTEALDALQAAVARESREIDISDSTPEGIARHVSRVVMASSFSPLFTMIQARNAEEKVSKLADVLKGLDLNKGSLHGGNKSFMIGFQRSGGPRNRDTRLPLKICKYCRLKGHEEEKCWKKHGRPPAQINWVDGDLVAGGAGSPERENSIVRQAQPSAVSASENESEEHEPADPQWGSDGDDELLVDTGAPISIAGSTAFSEYCAASGISSKLGTLPEEIPPLVWGKVLSPLGVGAVRVGVGADGFLSFKFIVVDSEDLPILIGEDELERHRLNVMREPPPLRLEGPHFVIPLERTQSQHLSIAIGHCSESVHRVQMPENAVLFTSSELQHLHKRFGHASAQQLRKILRLSGNAPTPEEFKNMIEMQRACDICKWYSGRRSTFKVAAEIEVAFNHNVSIDIMYLDASQSERGSPVLHAVCNGTKFNAAWFLNEGSTSSPSETAQDFFRLFFRGWISIFGSPHRVTVDQQTNLASADFKTLMLGECVLVDPVPVESHWSQGTVERHHEPLRKVYLRVRHDFPNMESKDCLAIAVRAINVTTGPEGLIPSLLVFGTIPRIALRPESAQEDSRETNVQRLSAAILARGAYERAIAEYRVRTAMNSQTPEFPGTVT